MLLLSMALAVATPATDADRADAQCLFTFALLGAKAENDPPQIEKLRIMSAWFMGRIYGRSPGIDVKALIKTANASSAVIAANTARCTDEADAMEQSIAAIRAGLTERLAEMQ